MTEPTSTPTAPDPAASNPTESPDSLATTPAPTEVPEGSDPESDPDNANTEAAKYRRRLRDTETQLTTTTERLTTYQRRAAELAITDVLATPADLFDVGNAEVADYLDDNGDLRTDELTAAATALVDQRPQLGKNYTPPWPSTSDYGQGVRTQSTDVAASWAKALAPERRNR